MSEEEEEMEFCMIVTKNKNDPEKLQIFPLPQKHCHCRNTDKKHFSMYGRFNKERTTMTPSSQEDVDAFVEYCEKESF